MLKSIYSTKALLLKKNSTALVPVEDISQLQMNCLGSPCEPTRSNMHRMLLVDDEADIVDILSRGLELKGMLVDAYSSPLTSSSSLQAKPI